MSTTPAEMYGVKGDAAKTLPVEVLRLSELITQSLHQQNIHTLDNLISHSEIDLLTQVDNLGQSKLNELKASLKGFELELVKPTPAPTPPKNGKVIGSQVPTTGLPMVEGRYHCPDCPEAFPKRTTLGMHRARLHGYVGPQRAEQARYAQNKAKTHLISKPKPKSNKGKRISETIKARIKKDYERGLLSTSEIAKKYGVHTSTVYALGSRANFLEPEPKIRKIPQPKVSPAKKAVQEFLDDETITTKPFEFHVGYAAGRIAAWLFNYCKSNEFVDDVLPFHKMAHEVGELLLQLEQE